MEAQIMTTKHEALIQKFLGENDIEQNVARMILFAKGEEVVEDLIDAYYAGVTVDQGQLILTLLAKIGGYEALNVLREVFMGENEYLALKRTAAEGLIINVKNLSHDERIELLAYLKGH